MPIAFRLPIFTRFCNLTAALVLGALLAGGARTASAQQAFASPEEGVERLVGAVRANNEADVLQILGSSGRDIISSGDKVEDEKRKAQFLTAFDVRHQIVKTGDASAELVIGPNDWPWPVPIVAKDGKWSFDTARGLREILQRRIGRNELDAIQASLTYVDAQLDYAGMNPEKVPGEAYAQRIISSPGKKDGLYWPAQASEPQSPLGPAFALATAAGYRLTGEQTPFHGYLYKVLTAQGPHAAGGAVNYIVNGKMIGGFALVAYPAEYGNSGIMTFIVNHAGTVWQKDLGEKTSDIAARMTTFDPDQSWKKVPEADLAVSH